MDLASMGGLVGSVGFPIAITLIIIYAIYKGVIVLCDKIFKPMLDRFLKSLDEITENNKTLVQTNSKFVGFMENLGVQIENIDKKVDKIIEELR